MQGSLIVISLRQAWVHEKEIKANESMDEQINNSSNTLLISTETDIKTEEDEDTDENTICSVRNKNMAQWA